MNFLFKVREFFSGRNGLDQLSFFILIIAFIASMIMTFFFRLDMYAWPRLIVYVLLGLVVWRVLSKNVDRRRRENELFMSLTAPFRKNKQTNHNNNGTFDTTFTNTAPKRDTANYKYLKCPECAAQLRVPRGKGKITVTCPKCKAKFKSKS